MKRLRMSSPTSAFGLGGRPTPGPEEAQGLSHTQLQGGELRSSRSRAGEFHSQGWFLGLRLPPPVPPRKETALPVSPPASGLEVGRPPRDLQPSSSSSECPLCLVEDWGQLRGRRRQSRPPSPLRSRASSRRLRGRLLWLRPPSRQAADPRLTELGSMVAVKTLIFRRSQRVLPRNSPSSTCWWPSLTER